MFFVTSPAPSAPRCITYLAVCGFLALAAVSLELPPASAEAPPDGSDPSGPFFLRGDSNADGGVDLSDAVHTLSWLFLGGARPACDDAADTDDDQQLGLTDAVYTLNFLFLGGAVPPPPGPEACGPDPSEDALGCGSHAPCEEEVSPVDSGPPMGRVAAIATCLEAPPCAATPPEELANGSFVGGTRRTGQSEAQIPCWRFVVDETTLDGIIRSDWFGDPADTCPGKAAISYADDGNGPHTAEAHWEQDFDVVAPLGSAYLRFSQTNGVFSKYVNGRSTVGTHTLRAVITNVACQDTVVWSTPIPNSGLVGPIDVTGVIGETGTYRLKLSLRVEGADNRTTGISFGSVSLTTTPAGDTSKNLIGVRVRRASSADVTPGSADNEILKVEFTVTGSTGTMNLQKVEVTAKNSDTTNDDVTAVKIFFNTTDSFTGESDITLGGPYTFPSGAGATVLVDVVDTDLPNGSSFIWIAYDIAETATRGDTVDAILGTGSIVTEDDQIWPSCPSISSRFARTIKKGGGRRPR